MEALEKGWIGDETIQYLNMDQLKNQIIHPGWSVLNTEIRRNTPIFLQKKKVEFDVRRYFNETNDLSVIVS